MGSLHGVIADLCGVIGIFAMHALMRRLEIVQAPMPIVALLTCKTS